MSLPRKPDWLKMGGVSLAIHIVLVIVFSLNPWPIVIKAHPTAYTVTLTSIVLPQPAPEIKEPAPIPKETKSKPVEKPKPVQKPKPIEKIKPITKPKKDDIVEKVKKPPPKVEKTEEKKVEKIEEKKVDLKRLQEELEEIRKKAALDKIQKRVARREKVEKQAPVSPPDVPMISSTTPPSNLKSKLNLYYSVIWAKIKEAWTIPQNLLEERVDLETIIVIIIESDGKIQKYWFEKKSGDDLYDQMALRAIMKAEPLPPIPEELSESTLEIGIRFFPD